MRRKVRGFTLFELMMAATLAGITLSCIIQFFLTQLNQYRLIAANNQLNEDRQWTGGHRAGRRKWMK